MIKFITATILDKNFFSKLIKNLLFFFSDKVNKESIS